MTAARNPCRYCSSSFYDERTGHRISSLVKPECVQCVLKNEHKQYLDSKRKFKPGEPIKDLNTLLEQTWIIFGNQTRHIEVIKSMQFRTVLQLLNVGIFRLALNNEKENENGRNQKFSSNTESE